MKETASSPANTREPSATTFSVSTSRQGFVIGHLTDPPFPLRFLKKIQVLYIDPNRATLVPLAESILGTVKQLRFGAISIHRAEDEGMLDFVSRLTNLETLIVDKIYVLRPGDGPMESLLWIPPVLRCVTAPIRRLGIELMIKNIDRLDSMDWPQVDFGQSVPVAWTRC